MDDGSTPADFARSNGHASVAQLLDGWAPPLPDDESYDVCGLQRSIWLLENHTASTHLDADIDLSSDGQAQDTSSRDARINLFERARWAAMWSHHKDRNRKLQRRTSMGKMTNMLKSTLQTFAANFTAREEEEGGGEGGGGEGNDEDAEITTDLDETEDLDMFDDDDDRVRAWARKLAAKEKLRQEKLSTEAAHSHPTGGLAVHIRYVYKPALPERIVKRTFHDALYFQGQQDQLNELGNLAATALNTLSDGSSLSRRSSLSRTISRKSSTKAIDTCEELRKQTATLLGDATSATSATRTRATNTTTTTTTKEYKPEHRPHKSQSFLVPEQLWQQAQNDIADRSTGISKDIRQGQEPKRLQSTDIVHWSKMS
eukprot:g4801.t1